MGLVGNYRVVTDGPVGWTVPGHADAMDSMKRLATLLLLASAALVACGDDDSAGSSGERANDDVSLGAGGAGRARGDGH